MIPCFLFPSFLLLSFSLELSFVSLPSFFYFLPSFMIFLFILFPFPSFPDSFLIPSLLASFPASLTTLLISFFPRSQFPSYPIPRSLPYFPSSPFFFPLRCPPSLIVFAYSRHFTPLSLPPPKILSHHYCVLFSSLTSTLLSFSLFFPSSRYSLPLPFLPSFLWRRLSKWRRGGRSPRQREREEREG